MSQVLSLIGGRRRGDDSTGKPIIKPPFADLYLALGQAENIANKPLAERLKILVGWLRAGGQMDYQRYHGQFHKEYMPFANYAYGAIMAAAGIPLYMVIPGGIAYNLAFGKIRPSILGEPKENIYVWIGGHRDYQNGKLNQD